MKTLIRDLLLRMDVQVVIALLAAVLVGANFPAIGLASEWMGTVFLNTLKMIIPFLLFFSIFTSVLGMGDPRYMGVLGGRTLGLYLLTTCLAVITAIVLMNVLQPGAGFDIGVTEFDPGEVQKLSISDFLAGMVPVNILDAFLRGDAMQLVVLAFVFGFAALRIVPEARETMYAGAERINDLILEFTKLIILLTPIGVFGLVAALVAESGLSAITDMWSFCLVVISALAIHVLVMLPLLAWGLGRFNAYRYFRTVLKPILVGFSTASSSATLPVTMTTAVEKGGVEKKVAEFTFPMGSTVNMDGTCLYQGIVALFVAQALNVDLSIGQQFTIAFSVVLASIGASGIPGAGIVMLTVVFASVGLPIEAIAVIMTVDRFLDMFRTASNICGDLIVARIVNRHYLKTHDKISQMELGNRLEPA